MTALPDSKRVEELAWVLDNWKRYTPYQQFSRMLRDREDLLLILRHYAENLGAKETKAASLADQPADVEPGTIMRGRVEELVRFFDELCAPVPFNTQGEHKANDIRAILVWYQGIAPEQADQPAVPARQFAEGLDEHQKSIAHVDLSEYTKSAPGFEKLAEAAKEAFATKPSSQGKEDEAGATSIKAVVLDIKTGRVKDDDGIEHCADSLRATDKDGDGEGQ